MEGKHVREDSCGFLAGALAASAGTAAALTIVHVFLLQSRLGMADDSQ